MTYDDHLHMSPPGVELVMSTIVGIWASLG